MIYDHAAVHEKWCCTDLFEGFSRCDGAVMGAFWWCKSVCPRGAECEAMSCTCMTRCEVQRCEVQRCEVQRCEVQRCEVQRCEVQRCEVQHSTAKASPSGLKPVTSCRTLSHMTVYYMYCLVDSSQPSSSA